MLSEHLALVAQMVERKTLNLVVVGSSPTEGASFCHTVCDRFGSCTCGKKFEYKIC